MVASATWHTEGVQELTVSGIRLIEATNEIVLVLANATLQLPIWIGSPEAAAIALSQQGYAAHRPLTHDLICSILDALDAPLERVEITAIVDGIFHAELVLSNGTRIAARPSDAVAIALRAERPILAADAVLSTAGVALEPSDATTVDLDEFRAFLDEVSPEDFGQPGES